MHRSRAVRWAGAIRGDLARAARSLRTKSRNKPRDAGRGQEGLDARLAAVERRLAHLESMIEGLQDSVHRESIRQGEKIDQLQKNADPAALRRALGRDAREHGL
jgi:hypothetical protein